MGCGTSSPKPVKTNTQTNKNLPTSGAAPTNNQTNGKAGPNQGETSNSQIDVQIDPNSSQNNGNLPSETSEGVHGSAENGADTLESKDKNGGTDGNGTQQKNDTNTKTSSGKKIVARPNNQNVKAPNLQRYDNNAASGNTIQRNTPTNSTRTRVSRPAGRSTPGYASPRNHTYPRYPIAKTDGRFQHSRARSVPPKNQQQRLSDELANDPAFRKKLLIESNERLKAQESQPKTGGGDNKSNTRLNPQENRTKQSGRDNSSDRSRANNNQSMKGGKDNVSSDKLKAPGNKSQKGGGNNKALQDKRDTQNVSKNGNTTDRSPQKTNWEQNQDDAIDQSEKSDDVSSQSPRDSSKDETPRTKQRRIVHPPLPRYEDPHERARARRIRFMLRQAMLSNNLDELDEAIWQFETNNMVDLGDLTEAIKRLEILQLKKDLKQAIGRRNLGILNTAIDDTYNTHHEQALRGLLDRAEELRDHLQALNHYSHDIMQMDHNVISEIRSYCNPPPSIHEVMAACYMLLGIKEEKLLDWPDVQSYLGRVGQFGLKNMIMNFDPDRVPLHTVLRVKEILNFYSLEDVRVASNGAACFYIWAKNMVDIIDNRRNQDEDGDRTKSSTKKG